MVGHGIQLRDSRRPLLRRCDMTRIGEPPIPLAVLIPLPPPLRQFRLSAVERALLREPEATPGVVPAGRALGDVLLASPERRHPAGHPAEPLAVAPGREGQWLEAGRAPRKFGCHGLRA